MRTYTKRNTALKQKISESKLKEEMRNMLDRYVKNGTLKGFLNYEINFEARLIHIYAMEEYVEKYLLVSAKLIKTLDTIIEVIHFGSNQNYYFSRLPALLIRFNLKEQEKTTKEKIK